MLLHNVLAVVYFRLLAVFSRPLTPVPNRIASLSVVIPVFNEEDHITVRMDNLQDALAMLEISYEVLIGVDGSTDHTPQVIRDYLKAQGLEQRWRLLNFPNEGKGQTINKLVREAKGELIVSTDADAGMDSIALAEILRHFEADDAVGCVSSIPVFRSREHMSLQSVYWSFDLMIRDWESRMGKLVVVTGWLYAFRKAVFEPIPAGVMADDLWVPLTIILNGRRCIHHRVLKAYSEFTDESTEVKRRKRVMAGGIDVTARLWTRIMKDPRLCFLLFSHKVNRWLTPLWIVIFGISSLVLCPVCLFGYLVLLGLSIAVLGPRKFSYILSSLFSSALSLVTAVSGQDLSKWGHTRVGKAEERE